MEAFLFLAWSVPLVAMLAAALGTGASFVRMFLSPPSGSRKLICQITTRGEGSEANEVIEALASLAGRLPREIWVVVEEGAPASFPTADRVVEVPADFRCRARAKGRALEWARRVREREGITGDAVKVLLLDDDSVPSARYLRCCEDVDADIAQGIVAPRRHYGRLLSHLDDLRPLHCLAVCSWAQARGKPIHVHGEGLCLRASAEHAVGWSAEGSDLAEDLVFGQRASALSLRWSFLPAVIENTSPWTARALVTQRKRWTWGTVRAMWHIPVRARLRIAALYLITLGGFAASTLGAAMTLIGGEAPAGPWTLSLVAWLTLFALSGWISSNGNVIQSVVAMLLAWLTAVVNALIVPLVLILGPPAGFRTIAKLRPSRPSGASGPAGLARFAVAVLPGLVVLGLLTSVAASDPASSSGPRWTEAAADAPHATWIGHELAEGFGVDTGSGLLSLEPLGVSTSAGVAQVSARDSAATFEDTARNVDTTVRPTGAGIESLVSLKDPLAPEAYGYRVDLAGAQELRQLGNGTVQIVDPTPTLPLPPRPLTMPARPAIGGANRTSRQAHPGAIAAPASKPIVVAQMAPTRAEDAEGTPVDTGLLLAGDTVTMTVSHRGTDAVYPVVADSGIGVEANSVEFIPSAVYREGSRHQGASYEGRDVFDHWELDPVIVPWEAAAAEDDDAIYDPQRLLSGPPQTDGELGVNLVSYSSDDFAQAMSAGGTGSIGHVQQKMSAERVVLVPITYTRAIDSNFIFSIGAHPETSSTESVRSAIREAARLGLNVTIKPHVNVITGAQRGGINPHGPRRSEFFEQYRDKVIEPWAAVAADFPDTVDQFVIGTELCSLNPRDGSPTRDSDIAEWRATIETAESANRSRSAGQPLAIGYASDYDCLVRGDRDGWGPQLFADRLDFLGVNYFPGESDKPMPTLLAEVRATRAEFDGMPFYFTELGSSAVKSGSGEEQRDRIESVLDAFKSDVTGFWVWNRFADKDNEDVARYTLEGPAIRMLGGYFEGQAPGASAPR